MSEADDKLRVWTRIEKDSKVGTLALAEIRCRDRSMRTVQITDYGTDPPKVRSRRGAFLAIAPDSIGEALHAAVCRK